MSGVVRILEGTESDQAIGAGCLISPEYLITCAHVLDGYGSETIYLDFPLVAKDKNRTEPIKARIFLQFPPQENPDFDEPEDIAILQFLQHESIPADVTPVSFKDTGRSQSETSVSMYGFPEGLNEGKWIAGEPMGLNGKGYIQIDCASEKRGIERGFSGTPVWNKAKREGYGIVVAKLPGTNCGYCIPFAKLRLACPEEECHDSLVERFVDERVHGYLKQKKISTVLPYMSKAIWAYEGSLEMRKNKIKQELFGSFDRDYSGSVEDVSELTKLPEIEGRHAIVIAHQISVSGWDEIQEKLLKWYMECWKDFSDPSKNRMWLIFLNIVYVDQPMGLLNKFFNSSLRTRRRVEQFFGNIKSRPIFGPSGLIRLNSHFSELRLFFGQPTRCVSAFLVRGMKLTSKRPLK